MPAGAAGNFAPADCRTVGYHTRHDGMAQQRTQPKQGPPVLLALLSARRRPRCRLSPPAQGRGIASLAGDVRPDGAANAPAHAAGRTVGDHPQRDGMARYRSKER